MDEHGTGPEGPTPSGDGSGNTGGLAGLEGYDRVTLLGRGGTAAVYSATRRADSTPVAIKVFDEPDSSAFSRQRRAAASLGDIDGVLGVLDEVELSDGRRCLILPFAAGGSLADHMDRFGPMAPADVAALGAPLARALGAAHRADVLHRDVKPSNVLMDGPGRTLLADFGAATTVEPSTATETMAVTIMYAAPEVLERGDADARSDIYSLGLTLLALAIGRHPMGDEGDSGLAALINRICTDGVPDPGELGLPDGLAAVLRRASEMDPDERYASADQFAAALDEVAVAPSVAPIDSQRTPRSERRMRRAAAWMLVGVSAATIALAVLGMQLWSADTADIAADQADDAARDATVERFGEPATEASGRLGPLYEQAYATYVGRMEPGCEDGENLVQLSIHAGPADNARRVATPWDAVAGDGAGTFVSYMPCDTGTDEARYFLGATGRWFVLIAEFSDDQYQRMSASMRDNEVSESPDYTVDDDVLETLENPDVYRGWAIIDQEAE